MAMRYYRVVSEGYHAPDGYWGDPTYWLEVNDRGDAERELAVYPNGSQISYDQDHQEDAFGALSILVIDGDEDWWADYSISCAEFEAQWRFHQPMNRSLNR